MLFRLLPVPEFSWVLAYVEGFLAQVVSWAGLPCSKPFRGVLFGTKITPVLTSGPKNSEGLCEDVFDETL